MIKNLGKLKIHILAITAIIVVVVSVSLLFFNHYYYYKTGDKEDLNAYFEAIMQPDVFQKGSEKYRKEYEIYQNITVDYGPAIKELAKLNYSEIPEKDALNIIRNKDVEKHAYQVNVYFYSISANIRHLVNIVYFQSDETEYALAFYSNYPETGQSITLYKVSDVELSELLADEIFKNNNLISRLHSNVLKQTIKSCFKIAGTLIILYILLICAVKYIRLKKR